MPGAACHSFCTKEERKSQRQSTGPSGRAPVGVCLARCSSTAQQSRACWRRVPSLRASRSLRRSSALRSRSFCSRCSFCCSLILRSRSRFLSNCSRRSLEEASASHHPHQCHGLPSQVLRQLGNDLRPPLCQSFLGKDVRPGLHRLQDAE